MLGTSNSEGGRYDTGDTVSQALKGDEVRHGCYVVAAPKLGAALHENALGQL